MRHLLSKKEIIIDLTSLLDVIFIVLMVVMVSQKMQQQSVQAQDSNEPVTIEDLKEHYEKYENLDEYVLFIDIYSDINVNSYNTSDSEKIAEAFLQDDQHTRRLYCIKGIGDSEEKVKWVNMDGNESEYIDVRDSTEETVLGKDGMLDRKLSGLIESAIQSSDESEYGNVIVILSVNRNEDKILYRDEFKITKLLEDIADRYRDSNVMIAVR